MAFLYRLLPPRPTFIQDMTSDEAEAMQRHAGYWRDLLDRGVAVAYGPVYDPDGGWGLGLLQVDDEAQAREIADADPAVAGGVCTYAVLPIDLITAG